MGFSERHGNFAEDDASGENWRWVSDTPANFCPCGFASDSSGG